MKQTVKKKENDILQKDSRQTSQSVSGQNQINELQEKVVELTNNWKRALADYQNLVRRTEVEKKQWSEFSSKRIINKFLPVLDTLDQAESHIKDDGLSTAIKQFRNVLASEGVAEIEALGKTFDPAFHECIETEEGDHDHKISKVFFKGYLLNGKVLRPAKVRVIKKKIDKKDEQLAKKAAQTGNYM